MYKTRFETSRKC